MKSSRKNVSINTGIINLSNDDTVDETSVSAEDDQQHKKRKVWARCVFILLAVFVNFLLIFKLPLFLKRQFSSMILLHKACPGTNISEESIPQQYVFTTVVYSILYFGRALEALIFHIYLYKFIFCQKTIKPLEFLKLFKERWVEKTLIFRILFVCLAFIMLLFSLSIPSLGMVLEARHGNAQCNRYIYEHHFVYWILDIVRYLHDVLIRLLLVIATIAIRELWSNSENDSDNVNREPENYEMYLKDREVTSQDHLNRTLEYVRIGGKVECILEIFQTWFITPWALFLISSSLDSEYILRYLRDNSNRTNSIGSYDFAEIAFMVYSFNQIFLLGIAYVCSKMINDYHQNYLTESRYQQLNKFKSASRKAMASMNNIEAEDNFNFVPRIWGLSIKIKVDNPLYVITLFVSTFFAIANGLV